MDRGLKKLCEKGNKGYDATGYYVQIMRYLVDGKGKRTGARGLLKTYFREVV